MTLKRNPWAVGCVSTLALVGATLATAKTVEAQSVEYTLGLGAMYAPDYEGSDDYETTAVPLIDITVNDRFRFSTFEGPELSIQFLDLNGVTAEAGVGYGFGRKASDNVALGGLGDIDDAATFVAAIGYEMDAGLGSLNFGLDVEAELEGNRKGTQVGIEAGYDLPVFAQRGLMSFKLGSTWADDSYMQSTFGITAAQAASSTAGLSAYTAKSGIKDVSLSAALAYQLTDNMTLHGEIGVARLSDTAYDSPLVTGHGSRDQKFATLGILYSW